MRSERLHQENTALINLSTQDQVKNFKCYNLFFNQSFSTKFKQKMGDLAIVRPEKFKNLHNPLPGQLREYLDECELLSTLDLIEINSFRSDEAIFILPYLIGKSSINKANLNIIIRGFNRDTLKQDRPADNKDILIYYLTEQQQLKKLTKLSASFKGYQFILVLANNIYANIELRAALNNTLSICKNIGLVLTDTEMGVPAYRQLLNYIAIDAKLDDYREKRDTEPLYIRTLFNFFHFGFSGSVKISAAQKLQALLNGKVLAEKLNPYLKALSQGRLCQIYYEYLRFIAVKQMDNQKPEIAHMKKTSP
ncbi:MAG: hypothetical protein A3F11_01025 [Gammaproteobacteria bacterium RIFCSPHIGHO2_12_FULL_37_14]|nr:MAG: hypothetical protein A3F11_01025 [Gammaproteobacteria bacterium RIFCSPHIGHO2_12_FULL_37_14]